MKESIEQIMDSYYKKKEQLDKNINNDKVEINIEYISRINEIDLEISTLTKQRQQLINQSQLQTILSDKNDFPLLQFDEIISQSKFVISGIDDKLECLGIEKSILLCFFDKSKNNESDYVLLIELKNKTRKKLLSKRNLLLLKEQELKQKLIGNSQQLFSNRYNFEGYEQPNNISKWKQLYEENEKISNVLEAIKITLDLINESIEVLKLNEDSLLYVSSDNFFEKNNKIAKKSL